MGLDIWMQSKSCEKCGHQENTEYFHCTYNLWPMWSSIYPEDEKLVDIDGLSGKKSLCKLTHAHTELTNYPDKFIAMNPSNNWGSYDVFLYFIEQLIDECELHPDWVWCSWR